MMTGSLGTLPWPSKLPTANLRILSTTTFVVLLLVAKLRADDSKPYEPYETPRSPATAITKDDTSPKPARQEHRLIRPCLGRGYVPYSYPAIDSCPCARNCCFHPGRYYCGGKAYRKQWFRKWLRAHLGSGSMLDEYPCQCTFPTAGRPYLKSVSSADTSSKAAVPPSLSPVPPANN